MQYITSIEKRGVQQGLQKGLKKGLRYLINHPQDYCSKSGRLGQGQ